MLRVALSSALVAATLAAAQSSFDPTGTEPLTDKHFSYPTGIPYQVDPNDGVRGSQSGYNICNSTTEGQNSLCQTGFVNSVDDWCVWAPPTGPTTIGDSEGQEVAWCTKPGRGTRLIPEGAITGVQFLKAPSYLEVIAFLDQTKLNLEADDFGGELDPHGADLRGNPLGGLMFSNALPMSGTGDNNTYTQVEEWHNFIGANLSCFKVCDPKDPNAGSYCYNRLDRVGINYVCPNQAQNNVFEMCDSDNQYFVGVYTTDGQTVTYTQPPESLGPITSIPFTAPIPSSSNCVTYQSSDLFAALASVTASGAASTGSAGASASASGTASGSTATGKSGSASGTATRTSSGASSSASATGASTQNSGAGVLASSSFATIAGVAIAVAFFA